MKNPLPEITAAIKDDPASVRLIVVGVRDLILTIKLMRAAKRGNTARCVMLAAILLHGAIADTRDKPEKPAKVEDPFADIVNRVNRASRDAAARRF